MARQTLPIESLIEATTNAFHGDTAAPHGTTPSPRDSSHGVLSHDISGHSTSMGITHTSLTNGFFGSSFKLLRACNFCRKRKIKCTVLTSNSVCEHCKEHNRACIFDHKAVIREPPTRRKQHNSVSKKKVQNDPKPRRIITATSAIDRFDVALASGTVNRHLSSYTGTFLDQIEPVVMEQYNKAVDEDNDDVEDESPVESYARTTKRLEDPTTSPFAVSPQSSLRQLYTDHIEPYTPFLAPEVFETELSPFATCCINIAAVSSLTNRLPGSAVESFLSVVRHELQHGDMVWDVANLSCFFLLPLRTIMPAQDICHSLEEFNRLLARNQSLPVNLMAAAVCVDAWFALCKAQPLMTNSSIFTRCCDLFTTLDMKDFNYQFLTVTVFVYKLIWLQHDTEIPYEDKKQELLQFEFNMLLFPAKLSKGLIVVKDKLLSTPEAFILHILHNMLMIAYYSLAVTQWEFGNMTSIMAVPGLYHFISGMAISNFRVRDEIVGRWCIIADSQIYTAKLLVQLYRVMEFDTFTFALQFYTYRPNISFTAHESSDIDRNVKELLDNASVRERDDDFDGAVVFWVFRDVRSMSLQMYLNEKRRGSDVRSDMSEHKT
ncbi:hypothetical protein CANTEDRAFT_134891 [Yamadazyma tenuis ATCC 10573]|uniref:Zn(2)-C6 fungal-type domain-containing protein n=1 Tax=Candida tenuis (strain ATCC 10573 / BCRC 21748 / CBS 615 / JCM 9827 / NBRC 10315 / NRRL Y-1498 / VKM Y-70) TaxID=590646 RepID=G3B6Z0_CANTC|nr:uncharacterized protein CANTEDRAFT_134891 [Yamadazyma tenuis ATCC 10573]EGV63052.1 hypothetical protein CANTEDRAFT_134891 [Yamadazyma tenuis ATCC 10573]